MSSIRSVAFICATLATSLALAQGSAPLSFPEVARRTLASHPQFERFSLALQAAQARAGLAGLRPTLEAGVEAENIAGTGSLQGVDATEITLSLSSILERGGKREARMEAAARTADLLSTEQRVEALDLLAETGRRFVAVAVAQESLKAAQNRAAQTQKTLGVIIPRVAAARSPRTEHLNIEIEVSDAELAVADAQRDLETARFALAAQWAALTESPTVTADLFAMPEPRSFEALSADLARLPDLEVFASGARVRESELRLARAQAVADLRWSVGVRRLEAIDEQALVVGFSLPLGTRQRNASVVREAQLHQALTPLDADVRRLQLLPLLHAQWEELLKARAADRIIATEQLPRAREVLELTQRGYEIGRFPYRELALSQQQVLALEAQRLAGAARYHTTLIEIERLTGAHLPLLAGERP